MMIHQSILFFTAGEREREREAQNKYLLLQCEIVIKKPFFFLLGREDRKENIIIMTHHTDSIG